MFNKVIKKFKINKYSMIKHGSVAVITLFGVWILFGIKNVMITFPIALTSTVMGRQNFQVKTINKVFRILLVHVTIVTIAFISSQNLLIGIPINFATIFLIMYTIVSPYDLSFYKPFIMLYVFTQYSSITLTELPIRYLAVIFGVMIIILGNHINKVNEKDMIGKSIQSSLDIIIMQIENILGERFDKNLTINCSNIMRDLAYRIYITRYKRYLTTELGKIQFKLYIAIEHLNLFLRRVASGYKENKLGIKELEDLIVILKKIVSIDNNKILLDECKNLIAIYKINYYESNKYTIEITEVLVLIIENIEKLTLLDKNKIYKMYLQWERTNIDMTRVTFMEYLKPNTIRFNFAMRMAITLTFLLLISEFLGFYKIIWVIITVMSIMQPYYEDTIQRTRERIIGNVIAMLFIGIVINIIENDLITLLILVSSLYLLYGFKEYYKISLFAAIASICISSLTENINKLLFYRVIYVLIGVIIIVIVNEFLFPYRLKNGIEQLVYKITILNSLLVKNSIMLSEKKVGANEVRDIIIHSTLLCQKLNIRNYQYGDNDIDNFVIINNNYVIEVGYNILMRSGIEANK